MGKVAECLFMSLKEHVLINDKALTKGDGYGILECENVDLNILPDTEILLFDMGG